jgi:hypothetical protein
VLNFKWHGQKALAFYLLIFFGLLCNSDKAKADAWANLPIKYPMADLKSEWIIDTAHVADSMKLKRNKIVFRAPIYPRKLYVTDAAVQSFDTKSQREQKGRQFAQFQLANGKNVYCSTSSLDMRFSATYLCLLDKDNDGRLDSAYEVRSRLQTDLPIITHGRLEGYGDIVPVTIREIDRTKLEPPIEFLIEWFEGNGDLGRNILFTPKLHGTWGTGWLTTTPIVAAMRSDSLQEFEFLNLIISIRSTEKGYADFKISHAAGDAVMSTNGTSVVFGREGR